MRSNCSSWTRGVLVLASAGLALSVVWAYRPSLSGGFHFDDFPNFVDNPAWHWTRLTLDGLLHALVNTASPSRPLANVTFGLNHLLGGLDPFGYRVFNLVVHLAVGAQVGWLAWLLARRSGRSPLPSKAAFAGAWLAAALFLAHPLNSQAVAFVVQRMTSLAALFTVLAFNLYLLGRGGRSGAFWGAAIAWMAGLASKETAAALPLVVLAYEWAYHRDVWAVRLRAAWHRRTGRILLALAGGLCIAVAGGVVAWLVARGSLRLLDRWPHRDFNGLERLLTQSRVHLLYLRQLLWPDPELFNLDHHVRVSRSLWQPVSTAATLLFWTAVTSAIVVLARRRPRLAFPLIAYGILHIIESAPIGLELMFEHRMYLPLAFLAPLTVPAAEAAANRSRSWRRIVGASAVGVVAVLLVATHARAQVWGDPLRLAGDCARKSPDKYRPVFAYGTALAMEGRFAEAVPLLRRSIMLDPGASKPHNQLGNILLAWGRYDEARASLARAATLDPENAEAHYNLALALERLGRSREAAEAYRGFLMHAQGRLRPLRPEVERRIRRLEATPAGSGTPVRAR